VENEENPSEDNVNKTRREELLKSREDTEEVEVIP
jgi:hypothetical protein